VLRRLNGNGGKKILVAERREKRGSRFKTGEDHPHYKWVRATTKSDEIGGELKGKKSTGREMRQTRKSRGGGKKTCRILLKLGKFSQVTQRAKKR